MKIVKKQFVIMSNNRTRVLKGRGSGELELINDTKKHILYFDSPGKAQQTLAWFDKVRPVRSINMHQEKKLEIVPVTVTTEIPDAN